MAVRKINITVQESLLERMDAYCKANGISRSSLFSLAANQYLDAVKVTPSINEMFSLLSESLKKDTPKKKAEANIKKVEEEYGKIYGKKP